MSAKRLHDRGPERNVKTHGSSTPRISVLARAFWSFACCFFLGTCLSAGETALQALTSEERGFLVKNCPDINREITSGLVVAHGVIIPPPILVSVIGGKILLNGIQVTPRQQRPGDFIIRKRADQIESHFFADQQSRKAGARERVEKLVLQMKDTGKIDDFRWIKAKKNPYLHLEIRIGRDREQVFIGSLPGPLATKYHFLVQSLLREYDFKYDTAGKKGALAWLEQRFADLKHLGIVQKYHLQTKPFKADVMYIKFVHEGFGGGYGFGDYEDGVPAAVLHARLMSAQKVAELEASDIGARLRAGETLVYSFGFERHGIYPKSVFSLFNSIRDDGGDKATASQLRDILAISDKETTGLIEELLVAP